ncbi:LUD domain-containing protein [Natrononativus amylolyticus]|uniref:LUD domain-containing protein n=1 Tax=Natrononativus amylolyticus TaxID=2963434 RepID=UPI0020CE51F8|nr:LUD domain-containing protein [Natrononativus amylolyticus]
MGSQTRQRLTEALESLAVTTSSATAADLPDHVARVIDEPAVGAPLPFAPGALEATAVDTDPTPDSLASARTGVTPARFAIAEYGTLAIPSTSAGEEPVSLYPPKHVAVVAESDVYDDLGGAFDRLAGEFADGTDSVVFATGVSATADMGELVEGVHGPREVHVVVVTDR